MRKAKKRQTWVPGADRIACASALQRVRETKLAIALTLLTVTDTLKTIALTRP